MEPGREFSRLYTDLSKHVSEAVSEFAELKVEQEDGRQKLGAMMEKLRAIQAGFDGELQLLEEHAEWDKFTMAFFGETNAGKSTIIESLRIFFSENSRQQFLQQNQQDVARLEQAMTEHMQHVRDGLGTVYSEYANEIARIRDDASALSRILQDEAAARLCIAQRESSKRIRNRVLTAGAIGLISGGGVTALIFAFIGH